MERIQLGRFLMKALIFSGTAHLSWCELERALDRLLLIQRAMNGRIISPAEAWARVSRELEFLKFVLN